jgi:hypothetical protein
VSQALPDGRLVVNNQDCGRHGMQSISDAGLGTYKGSATVTVVPTRSALSIPMAPP